jgi:hypothetical protein
MQVLKTEKENKTAVFTITIYDEDHKFEVWGEDGTAIVEYQETLTWRGTIEVSEPDADIYRELMLSDEMTAFLESQELDGVRRKQKA